MSQPNLDGLFRPRSVAVVGASRNPKSVGSIILKNLIRGGFEGPILPVNPKYPSISGFWTYPDLQSLPTVPDLAVVCISYRGVPDVIEGLGKIGCKAAVVISNGLENQMEGKTGTYALKMLETAKKYGLRILGSNCVGLLNPWVNLNASFAHTNAERGNIAFLSQSGAMITSVLDWANSRKIGFSHFLSMGNMDDVDFGDVIRHISADPHTKAVLMYIETIKNPRKFISAARACSMNKFLLAMKSGRFEEGVKAAASHTGAMSGSDEVVGAALRRAGILRATSVEQMFSSLETISKLKNKAGDRLAILTNGGGAGVLATDVLVELGGKLAVLSPETLNKLNAFLPPGWSRSNPVDIVGDAPVERYVHSLKTLIEDPGSDAILFIHSPTAIVPALDIARALTPIIEASRKNVLCCFFGADGVREAAGHLLENDIPCFDNPEPAVRGYVQMVDYSTLQDTLIETPRTVPNLDSIQTGRAREIFRRAFDEGKGILDEVESKRLLEAYDIPTVKTAVARDIDEAVAVATELGVSVVLKILSPDIVHKADYHGVALNLETPEEVREAAGKMLERVKREKPEAKIAGFTVQPMVKLSESYELIAGIAKDPVMGSVVLFGQGGGAVEIVKDRCVSLPPLNTALAKQMIGATKIHDQLVGYRDRPPVDLEAICDVLVKLSRMVVDLPEIKELDINPLLVNENQICALDGRIVVEPSEVPSRERIMIAPYPEELESEAVVGGHKIVVRPIRPEDEPAHLEFIAKTTPEDRFMRFFEYRKSFSHRDMAKFTHIDYDWEMAFIASREFETGRFETLGVARGISDADNLTAEFSVLVRSDFQTEGLGGILMHKLIDYFRDKGTRKIVGQTHKANSKMIKFITEIGFRTRTDPEDPSIVELEYDLGPNDGLPPPP